VYFQIHPRLRYFHSQSLIPPDPAPHGFSNSSTPLHYAHRLRTYRSTHNSRSFDGPPLPMYACHHRKKRSRRSGDTDCAIGSCLPQRYCIGNGDLQKKIHSRSACSTVIRGLVLVESYQREAPRVRCAMLLHIVERLITHNIEDSDCSSD